MSVNRNCGTFNFAANFEGYLKAPIDARQIVNSYSALTATTTWCGVGGCIWLYDGAIVSVANDTDQSKRGIYYLCDSANYSLSCSWIKAGSGGGTITGATNGLSTIGQKVKLGGNLTGETVVNICGYSIALSGTRGFIGLDDTAGGYSSIEYQTGTTISIVGVYNDGIARMLVCDGSNHKSIELSKNGPMLVSDNIASSGLSYAGNYFVNNQNNPRWIPDKDYIDSLVTTGASVIGGFNGLGLLNRCICLGGTLVNDTIINASGNTLCVNGGYLSTENGYQISGVTILRTDPNDIDSIYIGDNCNFNISGTDNIGVGSWSLKSTTTGSNNIAIGASALSANTTGNGNVAIGYNAGMNSVSSNKLIIANNANTCLISGDFSTSGLTFNADICIGKTPTTGVSTDGFLVWNSADKCVKQVDVGSIISASITGATNGLTKVGQQVKFGGNLTGATTIGLCDNSLRLQSDTTNIYGLADFSLNSTYGSSKFGICSRDAVNGNWGLSGNSVNISAYHCSDGSNGSLAVINNTGITLSSKASSITCSVTLGTNALIYGGCYHSSYVNRTLVDKEYVDKQISGCSNMLKIRLQGGIGPFVMSSTDDVVAVSGVSTNELCLPSSPSIVCGRGQRIIVVDICGNALADPITINGNGKTINGGTCSVINTDYGSITFVYNGFFWSAIAFIN